MVTESSVTAEGEGSRSYRTSISTMVTESSVTTKGGRPSWSYRTSISTMVTESSVTTKGGRPSWSYRTSIFTMVTESSVTTKGWRPSWSYRTSIFTMVTESSVTTKDGRPSWSSSIIDMNRNLYFPSQYVTVLYRGHFAIINLDLSLKNIREVDFHCKGKNLITERYSTGCMRQLLQIKTKDFLLWVIKSLITV